MAVEKLLGSFRKTGKYVLLYCLFDIVLLQLGVIIGSYMTIAMSGKDYLSRLSISTNGITAYSIVIGVIAVLTMLILAISCCELFMYSRHGIILAKTGIYLGYAVGISNLFFAVIEMQLLGRFELFIVQALFLAWTRKVHSQINIFQEEYRSYYK